MALVLHGCIALACLSCLTCIMLQLIPVHMLWCLMCPEMFSSIFSIMSLQNHTPDSACCYRLKKMEAERLKEAAGENLDKEEKKKKKK